MKQGKFRTFSICLTDIKEKAGKYMVKASNGKLYLPLETFDFDEPDQYENDFSVSVSLTKEEREMKKAGGEIKRIFVGNGKIWENKEPQPANQDDIDDLPF